MLRADFVIVGSGLTGSTIARILADHRQDALIIERKNHIAGNVYDYRHASGATIHKYGPHYFRCGSERIWAFLNRFTTFYDWSAVIASKVNGDYLHWPVQQSFIEQIAGTEWNLFAGEPSNFEEACLSKMPVRLYEMLIKGYTEKQWGVRCVDLDKELAARVTINKADVKTLTPNRRWNALPRHGYTEMISGMIRGIPVITDCDYLRSRDRVIANKLLVFTGPIDEFFRYKHGKLKYRGQDRSVEYFPASTQYQPYVQVNYPSPDVPAIRTLEWKHLMHEDDRRNVKGTVVTHETPFTPDQPHQYEYPFPDGANKALYGKYRQEADRLKNVLICGRLGEYRYYDMDQAIGRAMACAFAILKQHGVRSSPRAYSPGEADSEQLRPLLAGDQERLIRRVVSNPVQHVDADAVAR
jgi:UDP-galactopyranose mutase